MPSLLTTVHVTISPATDDEFEELYALGRATPEFHVSASEPFMDEDEFRLALTHQDSAFLVAREGGRLAGFAYATTNDVECSTRKKWACLVYLVVLPAWRRQGVAGQLCDATMAELRRRGITHLYAWANAESPAILAFMEQRGFALGHRCVWVDRRIDGVE
jgi:GNAT superfamily N-acetyltransferase